MRQVVNYFKNFCGSFLPGKLRRTNKPLLSKFPPQSAIIGYTAHSCGNILRPCRVDQQPGASGNFRKSAVLRGNDRKPGMHCLENRHTEPFDKTGENQCTGLTVKIRELSIFYITQKMHASFQMQFAHQSYERLRVWSALFACNQ